MKKIFRKKGFTIVEVMVAFVIFAIMAAMVSSILQAALYAKQENVDLEEQITNQKNAYYQNTVDHKGAYDSSDNHNMSISFSGGSSGNVTVSMDYSLGKEDAGTTEAGSAQLNYINANLDYSVRDSIKTNEDDDDESDGDAITLGVDEKLETKIKGSNGYSSLTVYMIAYPDTEKGETNETTCRYLLAVKPVVNSYIMTYNKAYWPFMQFRFVFPKDNKIKSVSEAGFETSSSKFEAIGTDRIGYQLTKISTSNGDSLRFGGTMFNSDGTNTMSDYGYLGACITFDSPLSSEYINANGTLDLNKLFGYSDDAKTSNKSTDLADRYVFKPYYGVMYNEVGKVMNTDGGVYDKTKGETKMVGTHPNIYGAFVKSTMLDEVS